MDFPYSPRNPVGQIVGTTVFNLPNSLQQLRCFYPIKRTLAEQGKDIGLKTALDVDGMVRHSDMLLFGEPLQGHRLERVFCGELFTQVGRSADGSRFASSCLRSSSRLFRASL